MVDLRIQGGATFGGGMKGVFVILLCLLSVGCREVAQSSADGEKGELIGPILGDVPVVDYGASGHNRRVDVLNLKIEGEVVEYFLSWESVGHDWGEVERMLEERDRPVALKVWATPETRFSLVGSRIEEALKAGISRVDLVVKREGNGKPVWILPVDVPMMGESRGEICLMTVMMGKDGEVSTRNELGVVERFANLNTLSQRLDLHRSVAEVSKSQSILAFYVSDEVDYGRFCEVFSCLRAKIDYVRMVCHEEFERPVKPIVTPRKPAAPRPPSPGIPIY